MNKNFYKKLLCLVLTLCYLVSQDIENETKYPEVSIHAEDTHLPSILAILAQDSGYNIVTGPNVKNQNKLTIHLDNVPLDQALNLVIRAAGLSYEIVGNSILVGDASRLNEDVGVSPHVISLKYSKAEDIRVLLENITKDVTVDVSSNTLLVSASPKKIDEIREIVKEIDKPSIQIMLEARLIEVTLGDDTEMGVDWEKLAKTSLIFAETQEPQRVSDVNIASGSLPGETQYVYNEGQADEYIASTFQDLPFGIIPQGMEYTRSEDLNPFGRQLTAFDVTLDMLIQNNRAEILTNSQIVTINGNKATIEMVDVIPYVASSSGANGNMQVLQESVGVKLHILPYINTDGYITTEIRPEVSSIISFTGLGYPWTKRRVSTTTVRVKDGETIVIAGLVSTKDVTTETKVPILWRIPIIGKRWFTHKSTAEKTTDLIIQVKPSIVMDNYSGIELKQYHEEADHIKNAE